MRTLRGRLSKLAMRPELLPLTLRNALLAVAAALLAALPAWPQEAEGPAESREERGRTDDSGDENLGSAPPAEEPDAAAAEPVPGTESEPAAEGETAAEDAPEGEDGPTVVVDDEEGSVLDDQTFEGEEDDFIPTEEIPVDEPIPFPTDI